VAAVDTAFKVQLHQYTLGGLTFHASAVTPTLPTGIAPLVVSVGGLSDRPAMPMIVIPRRGAGAWPNITHPGEVEGLPWKLVPLDAAVPQGVIFSAQCFYPPTTVSFNSSTATATYSGGLYGAAINNTVPGTLPPCGYQPSDLQKAYNLRPLYQVGLDGSGETIAIVDAFGSTTVQEDLAAFSARMGLQPANLQILGTPSASNFSTDPALLQWAGETTLDVEWAHAIAPGANILLVVAPTQSLDDLMAANLTAAQQPGVVSISNSWGYFESFTTGAARKAADSILKLATSKGISVNFASGDYSNGALALGYADVGYPASSPYATGVGGVSVALDPNRRILFQTAWGNNRMLVAGAVAPGSPPADPPSPGGLGWGSGGGVSNVYPLPPFQAFLRAWGPRRLVPDISWVADPFTGVEVVVTVDAQGDQSIGLDGGTSVATPMFSALWSIAVQKARRPLGQAALRLYSLPPWAITDVGPPISFANVTGTITDANGTQELTAEELAQPLQGQATLLSTLYKLPIPITSWIVLSFGTDGQLHAGHGWDPATGLGTPNGAAFVNALSLR
jgi:subtilase family serine protease